MNWTILSLSIIVTALFVWIVSSTYYQCKMRNLLEENSRLKGQKGLQDDLLNSLSVEFTKIAQDSLRSQQEFLVAEHSKDLDTKIDLFKAEEIAPINKLLKEFKQSIDTYQQAHHDETLEIKNAISTAEKYAKALTTNQNSRGEFGEDWLEQILKFADLQENIHYSKQFVSGGNKPDFVINLPDNKHLVIDSKVILKNYIEYRQSDNDEKLKKAFSSDLTNCIVNLAKKNYEEISELSQPNFILMYIPIESCINLIYTDVDFRSVVELANSRNIIIVGSSSLLVALRLVNQLWRTKIQSQNIENIIAVGESLYNNIALHAQGLLNIQQALEKACSSIKTEVGRFNSKHNGSIFKEAEKLHQYGINSKSSKSGKKIVEKTIPVEFLTNDSDDDIN